ncbi:C6 zinc finger domain-containing protein [Metarhizium album ARSEF 1941]|uniref:C6 zinc finger domain-containing protein n=1 Tax=Metarhizium album (strain ARSEF 1941) TaxID=1081103 RepID=A0A0B2WWU6_METAS|nr:C6 zinc finger domain-containing protein [Metarhizium album ARSEF 1941]KHN98079.1 C6 zinc finger domain-containing protein [Metarhizium album ARSEF 1941]
MLSTSRSLDTSSSPLSPHPSLLLLDYGRDHKLAWDTKSAKAEISARAPAYPSPPMSGSPSLPPKDPRSFHGRSEGLGGYSTTSLQDAYRTTSAQNRPVDQRLQLPPPRRPPPQHHPRMSVQYQKESNTESAYGYQASEGHSIQTAALYSSRGPPGINRARHQHPQPYGSAIAGTGTASQQSTEGGPSSTENQSMSSPKSQRKTKGHVASACVPCKRAHLRCDARPRLPEPVAYLNMSLEFVKGSATFWDAAGLPNMAGRNLGEVVLPAELEKVSQIQTHFNSEQKRREPNYLPPILGHGSQSIYRLGFTVEDFGRFPLNFHDHLAFVGANGYARPMAVRADNRRYHLLRTFTERNPASRINDAVQRPYSPGVHPLTPSEADPMTVYIRPIWLQNHPSTPEDPRVLRNRDQIQQADNMKGQRSGNPIADGHIQLLNKKRLRKVMQAYN